jgi:hypothetical protein
MTYCTIETITRATGVASSTMMPACSRTPAAPRSP